MVSASGGAGCCESDSKDMVSGLEVLGVASLIPRIWCPRLVVLGVASLIPRIWCPVWRCWVLRV